MTYQIRPAKRSEAKPLIGLYSESGCGKTLSGLYLARGFVGPHGRIGMIETEAGRGEAYDDMIEGSYDVISMREDFSPKNYGDALTVAEKSGLAALIIDSASHEWEGAGGVLGMAAANQAAGKKGPLVWQQPKMDHQRHFMLRLLSTPIPLVIVCMRAKYPMHEVLINGSKQWARSEVLEPKQSEDILFEMFVHGWIDRQHNFHGTKYTRQELSKVLVDGKPITYETGRQLALWAAGASDGTPTPQSTPQAQGGGTGASETDIPAHARPLCSPCSKDLGEEIQMKFVQAGTTTNSGKPYPAFWQCPRKIKGHEAIGHVTAIAKWKEMEKTV